VGITLDQLAAGIDGDHAVDDAQQSVNDVLDPHDRDTTCADLLDRVDELEAGAGAQPSKKKDEGEFVKEKPTIGDTIPDLIVYAPDGKEVKTSDLRGQHVGLTFGCLT